MTTPKLRLTVTAAPELVEAGNDAGASGRASSLRAWVSTALSEKVARDAKLARLKAAHQARQVPVTHAGVVGQVWRGDARQARLASALRDVDVAALDDRLARASGAPKGATGLTDAIDAALVLPAHDGDDIITGDPAGFAQVAMAADRHVELIRP